MAAEYNFRPQISGDTFNGVRITATRTVNDVVSPIDLTGAVISMQVRLDPHLEPVIDVSSSGDGVSILDALNGVFMVGPFMNPNVKSRKYMYDLQIQFPTGVVKTYLRGSYIINNDITS